MHVSFVNCKTLRTEVQDASTPFERHESEVLDVSAHQLLDTGAPYQLLDTGAPFEFVVPGRPCGLSHRPGSSA